MSRSSYARLYANPSRLMKECSPKDALKKIEELSNANASCIRVYFKCTGYGAKIANSSNAQKSKRETCFGPGKSTIDELWITVGEIQDTDKAVSYFSVPRKITCTDSERAKIDRRNRVPHLMYENDSLRRFQVEPFHRWSATNWNPKKWAIQY